MFPLQALLLRHIKKCISIEPGACKEKNSIKFMKVKSKWGLSDLWINPCGWDITIPIHTTLLSKQYLFIKKEPENDLDLSCTPLGLQHCNAVLPSLKISGSELYSEEQQQSWVQKGISSTTAAAARAHSHRPQSDSYYTETTEVSSPKFTHFKFLSLNSW